jgi:hypothetical protein
LVRARDLGIPLTGATEAEIAELIFMPGFSTSPTVAHRARQSPRPILNRVDDT